MKTLKIKIVHHGVELRLKGLSFKALPVFSAVQRNLFINDEKLYQIDSSMETEGRTAQPKLLYVVKMLSEIHESIPFENLIITNLYFDATSEELMQLIIEKNK